MKRHGFAEKCGNIRSSPLRNRNILATRFYRQSREDTTKDLPKFHWECTNLDNIQLTMLIRIAPIKAPKNPLT